jgi:PhnB protein
MSVKPIPDGFHTITPYLAIDGAAAAIEFYKKAFGAEEIMRMPGPGDLIMHAEVRIGDSPIMLSDANPEWGHHGTKHYGGSPVGLCVYVEDCDAAFKQAIEAGATEKRPLQDQFYGDRSGTVVDPFGYMWTLSTHKQDMTTEEIQAAAAKAFSQGGDC